ncbi:MAG: HTTM domain-containing protein [Bacteroidota bacterium]
MKLNLKNTILFRVFDPQWMWSSVHPASLGVVRFLFGLLMIEQTWKYERYIGGYLVHSRYLLHYDFFEWVEMLPAEWLGVLFIGMYISAILIASGFLYRLGMVFFFLGQTYCFLLDKGHYNNHYYMISLVAFWMIFTHWNRWFSLDHEIAKAVHRSPKTGILHQIASFLWQKRTPKGVPRWHLLTLQLLVFVVYFFGATAKLNPDWIEAYPMRIWLEMRGDWPVFGPLIASEGFSYFISYMGIAFDLVAAFILFSPRVRLKLFFVVAFMLPFHLTNDYLWRIGVFPEMMLGFTLLFFDPALPARGVTWLKAKFRRQPVKWSATAIAQGLPLPIPRAQKLIYAVLLVFFGWQLLFPLRIHLYPWPAEWHTNAMHFSWRMMLMDRQAATRIRVEMDGQPLGYVRMEDYFTVRQYRKFVKDPPEIVRFAHFLADDMVANGAPKKPEIYATVWRSINGRPYQLVMDSTANLVELPYHPAVIQDWLYPFTDSEKKDGNFRLLDDEEARNLGFGQYLGDGPE